MVLSNNAAIIMVIFGFYIALITLFGFMGQANLETSVPSSTVSVPASTGFLELIGLFFSGIGFTLSNIPAWANFLIFAPLGITIGYILLEVIALALP